MNKLKSCALIALCVLSIACCAVFSGCSVSYTVVSKSYKVENGAIRYYISLRLNSGDYDLDYTVCTYDGDDKVIDEESFSKSVEVGPSNIINISVVFESSSLFEVRRVRLERIKIKERSDWGEAEITAVVCGSLSAAVIAGLAVLFILDKKGKFKK